MKAILHKTLLSIIILFLFESCSKNKDIVIEHADMMFKHYQSIEKVKEIDYVVFSFHYEIYDVIIYSVIKGEINKDFCFDVLVGEVHIPYNTWKQCNRSNPVTNNFPIFDTENRYKKAVIANIDKGLLDSENWYNWNVKNDMNYLFLFCPKDNLLYYVKWNV